MKPFDIGYVPEGWERGEQLLYRAPCRFANGDLSVGWVRQEFAPLFGRADASSHIAEVRVYPDDVDRLEAWRKWWYGRRQAGANR